jgi:hypothetical protein
LGGFTTTGTIETLEKIIKMTSDFIDGKISKISGGILEIRCCRFLFAPEVGEQPSGEILL